jgi:hypothetical protein
MTRGNVIVMCNLDREVQRLPCRRGVRVLLASFDDVVRDDSSITLPPDSVVIVSGEQR